MITEQSLPNSDEKVFNIGYALLKLDRLDEAFSFFEKLPNDYFKEFFSLFEKLSGNPFEKTNIFLTGYYEGCDGNWHSLMIAVITMITMTMMVVVVLAYVHVYVYLGVVVVIPA